MEESFVQGAMREALGGAVDGAVDGAVRGWGGCASCVLAGTEAGAPSRDAVRVGVGGAVSGNKKSRALFRARYGLLVCVGSRQR